jgi:hypothetical protein
LFSTFVKNKINAKNNFQLGLNINYYVSNLNRNIKPLTSPTKLSTNSLKTTFILI